MRGERSIYVALGLISFATLVLQVSLTRLFSFTLYYYFAYMVISTALLGLAAAGSVVAVAPGLREGDVPRRLARLAVAAGLSIIVSLGVIARTPLVPGRLAADRMQWIWIAVTYIAVLAPFFLSGLSVTVILSTWSQRIGRLYLADLVGAGVGCACAVPLMVWGGPPLGIGGAAACFLLGGAVLWRPSRIVPGVLVVGALCVLAFPPALERLSPLRPSREKFDPEQAHLFGLNGYDVIYSRWHPIFRVDVLREISPGNGDPPIRPLMHDGVGSSSLWKFDGDLKPFSIFNQRIDGAKFLLAPPAPSVLIIGAAGGREVIHALVNQSPRIVAVELNPVSISLTREVFADWTGHLQDRSEVRFVNAEGRHFIKKSRERFDLIDFVAPDSYAAMNEGTLGAHVLSESYLYTVEAVRDAWSHLTENGVMAVGLGDFMLDPPRRTARFASVARAALESLGVAHPERHIVVLAEPPGGHLLPVSLVLVTHSALTDAQRAQIEDHVQRAGLLLWHGGGGYGGHLVSRILTASATELEQLYAAQKLNLRPVTDDNPFFWVFYKWRPGLLREDSTALRVGGGAGQVVLLVILVQSTILGALLILFPLLRLRRRGQPLPHPGRIVLYFAALGMGFMLLEISLIQKFVLFLGYPTYSLSVTLFALLVFAGAGSFVTDRLPLRPATLLSVLVLALGVVVTAYVVALPILFDALLASALAVRIGVTVALIAPLAITLGGFFPLGVRLVSPLHPAAVGWAWGINGFASVISAVLAVLLAAAWGFTALMLMAMAVYLIGALAFARLARAA